MGNGFGYKTPLHCTECNIVFIVTYVERCEDTKGVIGIRNSMKVKEYSGQIKHDKNTTTVIPSWTNTFINRINQPECCAWSNILEAVVIVIVW